MIDSHVERPNNNEDKRFNRWLVDIAACLKCKISPYTWELNLKTEEEKKEFNRRFWCAIKNSGCSWLLNPHLHELAKASLVLKMHNPVQYLDGTIDAGVTATEYFVYLEGRVWIKTSKAGLYIWTNSLKPMSLQKFKQLTIAEKGVLQLKWTSDGILYRMAYYDTEDQLAHFAGGKLVNYNRISELPEPEDDELVRELEEVLDGSID